MAVEILEDGNWVTIQGATAQHVDSNRYLVTIVGVPLWIRLTALDGAPLRVNGKDTFRVWGTKKSGTTLVLDVLVQ